MFMAVYGACVLSATLIGALATTDAAWQPARRLIVVLCALSILTFSQWALRLRRQRASTNERPEQITDAVPDAGHATSALGFDSATAQASAFALNP